MKKIKINIDWGVVFWVSIIILFLWFFAKSIGPINTPVIIQAIPFVVGIFTILSIVKEIGKHIQKLDTVISDVKEIKIDIRGMRTDIHSLDKRVSVLESRI